MGILKTIQYAVIYNRKSRLNKHGEALIQIRCYQNSICKYFSTGISIEPKYWHKRKAEINTKHPSNFVLNKRINDQVQAMKKYEMTMIERDGIFHIENIGNYEQFTINDGCFSDFFKEQLDTDSTLAYGTIKMRRSTLKKLITFNKNRKVYFSQLTYRFIDNLDKFLHSSGLAVNTVHTHHRMIKIYINKAIKYDLIRENQNPYKKFTPKTAPVTREHILEEELERIENLTFNSNNKHLERIRDMFLLSCYTGLRFSDVSAVKPKDIEHSNKGLFLKYTAQKTGKRLIMPLYAMFKEEGQEHSKPEKLIYKLLEQRKDFYKTRLYENEPFFKCSNQYTNRGLKQIAKLTDIDKNLTTHFARRMFATMAALKVPIQLVQQLLQHSNSRETAIYINDNPLLLAKELEKVKW